MSRLLSEEAGLALANGVNTLNNRIGDLTELNTTDKSSAVAAINELSQSSNSGGGDNIYENVPWTNLSYSGNQVFVSVHNDVLYINFYRSQINIPTASNSASGVQIMYLTNVLDPSLPTYLAPVFAKMNLTSNTSAIYFPIMCYPSSTTATSVPNLAVAYLRRDGVLMYRGTTNTALNSMTIAGNIALPLRVDNS